MRSDRRLHATGYLNPLRAAPRQNPTDRFPFQHGGSQKVVPQAHPFLCADCAAVYRHHVPTYIWDYMAYMDYKPRILGGMHIQKWMGWFFFRWRDGGKTSGNHKEYILSNGELNNIYFCQRSMVVFLIFFGRKIRKTYVFLYSRNQPTIKYHGDFLIGFGTESKKTRSPCHFGIHVLAVRPQM